MGNGLNIRNGAPATASNEPRSALDRIRVESPPRGKLAVVPVQKVEEVKEKVEEAAAVAVAAQAALTANHTRLVSAENTVKTASRKAASCICKCHDCSVHEHLDRVEDLMRQNRVGIDNLMTSLTMIRELCNKARDTVPSTQ